MESPWRDSTVRWHLDRLETTATPKLVEVKGRYDAAVVSQLWQVAEFSDYLLLLDGNHRFGLAFPHHEQPIPGRGVYADLADALYVTEWA